MKILFLSADWWRPEGVESDTVSLLVNGEILVDTGWHPVHNLIRENVPVGDVRTVLLTHLHQDHRLGLPALLFYHLNGFHDLSGIQVYGPQGVGEIAQMALEFAGKSEYFSEISDLQVHTVAPGDTMHKAGLQIDFAPSHHAVPGLMMRFTDENGRVLVYSGDTAPHEDTVRFAMGADILIHEHSWGASRPQGMSNSYGHSSAEEAADIALRAGVGKLILVHANPAIAQKSLARAQEIFANTVLAQSGNEIIL